MFKKLFAFLSIVVIALIFWCAFGLWTGIYSIYTYPPCVEKPEGETLLVSREEGEPTFNSPAFTPPPKKVQKKEGISFAAVQRPHKPIKERTIVTLPYIEWAYEQSLKPQE